MQIKSWKMVTIKINCPWVDIRLTFFSSAMKTLLRWELAFLAGFFFHGFHSRFTYLYFSCDGERSNFYFFFNHGEVAQG